MAFDLSWLWDLLKTIEGVISDVIEYLWGLAEPIVNTGQGILMGLVTFGSQLWDAIIKGLYGLGEWLYKQFMWVYEGLKYWADVFGQWFNTAMGWIGSGLNWIAQQLYNMGMWFYNIGLFIWNWIVNTITGLWTGLITWFSGLAGAISSWWASVTTSINTWFTNLLKTFRTKMVTTIMADIAIAGAWKGAERILAPQKMSDIGYGLLGVVASPIVGRLVGEIVNMVVPMPSSTIYPLIPEITAFAYTPPSIEITTPTEPTKPEAGIPPPQPELGYGLPLDKVISEKVGYDVTMKSTDKTLTETLGREVEVEE